MTIQEMFDKAVRGLASQGWNRCLSNGDYGTCCYSNQANMRCAWGWVDLELGIEHVGTVYDLANNGGIAATLSREELQFARQLQIAHDGAFEPRNMLHDMRVLARDYGLKWPEGVNQ